MRTTDELDVSERASDLMEEVCDSSARWLGTALANIENFIEQYPWPTLLVGIGLGYLVARRVR